MHITIASDDVAETPHTIYSRYTLNERFVLQS